MLELFLQLALLLGRLAGVLGRRRRVEVDLLIHRDLLCTSALLLTRVSRMTGVETRVNQLMPIALLTALPRSVLFDHRARRRSPRSASVVRRLAKQDGQPVQQYRADPV